MAEDRKSTHLIVVDTETGGLEPRMHCIVELAAAWVTIDPNERKVFLRQPAPFHGYIFPAREVTKEAASVNGYSHEKWKEHGALSLYDVARQFVAWLANVPVEEDLIWTGSNVTGFDLPFLRNDFAKVGLELPGKPKFRRRALNTESLCFPLHVNGEVDSLGIQALRNWAGLEGDQKHTALEDVKDAIQIIRRYFELRVWIGRP